MPPSPPGPDGVQTDCAVCHGPERSPPYLYSLLSDGKAALEVGADASVPADLLARFRAALDRALAESAVEIRAPGSPGVAPVRVEVRLDVGAGTTDRGAGFTAARATAIVALHRVRVEVAGDPGIAREREEAVRAALESLAGEVALVLGG